MNRLASLCLLVVAALVFNQSQTRGGDTEYWVAPMKRVHAKFKGEKGTFAHFGDSITITMAFWTPMLYSPPKNMDTETGADYKLVKGFMQNKCWRKWKGAQFGNNGGMTIRWAHSNVDKWLEKLNPEVALIMFGTNDLAHLKLDEYEQKTRKVVQKCLDNGTVVILSTIPPRHGHLEKAKSFADAVRRVGKDMKIPVCDYMTAILERRPDDWNGTLDKFKDREGYDVLTLVSGDGVHPSNPQEHRNDFSKDALRTNGYTLRNFVVLKSYADVVRQGQLKRVMFRYRLSSLLVVVVMIAFGVFLWLRYVTPNVTGLPKRRKCRGLHD